AVGAAVAGACVAGACVAGVEVHADAINMTTLATEKTRARIQNLLNAEQHRAGRGLGMVKARCAHVNVFSAWLDIGGGQVARSPFSGREVMCGYSLDGGADT